VKVKFVKQYTLSYKGKSSVFRRYQADNGEAVDIRVRTPRGQERTNAEADQEARRQLAKLGRRRRKT
jgi:hypothetical protein